jgi:2-methylcitrate dehydratase PrpD
MTDAGAVIVEHVAAATTGLLPQASRERTARLTLDAIGAAVAAHSAAGLPAIRAVVEGWGGRPDATVKGIAAQSAVLALEFARAGITGVRETLEGRAGWYPAFFGGRFAYSRDRLLADLGTRFLGDEISIKPYACCKYGHNAITAAVKLRSDPDVTPASIREVTVRAGQDTWDIICDPLSLKGSAEHLAGPDGLALAQFSLPFMVATALLRGRLSAAELDQEWRASAELAVLLRKVRVTVDDADFGQDMIPEPGRVEVVLGDGRRRHAEAERSPGHPDYPLDDAALHGKFRSCARHLGERRTEALLDALTHLDDIDDMRQVTKLTGPE